MSRVARARTLVQEFIAEETASGTLVVGALVAGLAWYNLAPGGFVDVWRHPLGLEFGVVDVSLDARGWINHGLMTAFFLAVGLELKREFVRGELRDVRSAALPVLCAFGGVVVPAVVYVALMNGSDAVSAWGVPTATDLALVLGVLALLGSRVPTGLKLFMLTLAITDDLIGIGLIAVFYSHGIDAPYLAGVCVTAVAIVAARPLFGWLGFRGLGLSGLALYVALGVVLWYFMLRSGVEAPLAGAILGILTPTRSDRWPSFDVLERVERSTVAFSAFVAVPLFAVSNAQIDLDAGSVGDAVASSATWSVVTARLVGKIVGIVGVGALVTRLGWGRLPDGLAAIHLRAAAVLSGIGFAVSFFIAEAALDDQPEVLEHTKFAVLLAAIIAATLGAAILTLSSRGGRNAPTSPS